MTRTRIRTFWIILFIVLGLVRLMLPVVFGDYPLLVGGLPFMPDFLAHWTGGRMFIDEPVSMLYEPATQATMQDRLVGSGGLAWFVSPPYAVWLYLPFAAMPYGVAALCWSLINLVLLGIALSWVRPLLTGRMTSHHRLFILAFCASPAVFETVGSGQDSMLALIVSLGALRLLSAGRDLQAGALIALGAFKPQLLVLVPFMFIAQRRWRALAGSCAAGLAILVCGLLIGGPQLYVAWYDALTSPLYANEVQRGQAWMMQSLPALVTGPTGFFFVGPVLLALGALLVMRTVRRQDMDTQQAWVSVIMLTIVTSPHVMIYDTVLLLPCLAWMLSRIPWCQLRIPLFAVFALQWLMPLLHAISETTVLGASWFAVPWVAIPLTVLTFRTMRWHPVIEPAVSVVPQGLGPTVHSVAP